MGKKILRNEHGLKSPSDECFVNIIAEAAAGLKDTRWNENQEKRIAKIKLLIIGLESHVAWAQMH